MHLDKLINTVHLSPKEAAAYMALIDYGPQAASTLAKLISVNRTTIYDILNQLQKRGLILSYSEGKNTFYFVDDVKKLLTEQEQAMRETVNIVQELESRTTREQIGVRYIQGQDGLRSIYQEILKKKPKELLGWMDLDIFYGYFAMDEEIDQAWTDQRKELGIFARLLLQKSPMTQEFKSHDPVNNRECRLLEKQDSPFETTCFLYGDTLCIVDPCAKGVGLVITNPRIFSFFMTMFETCWKSAR